MKCFDGTSLEYLSKERRFLFFCFLLYFVVLIPIGMNSIQKQAKGFWEE